MNRKEVYLQDLKQTKSLMQAVCVNTKFLKQLLDIVKEVYYADIELEESDVTIALTNTNINKDNPLGVLIDKVGHMFSIDAINEQNALITYRATLPTGPQGPIGPQGPKGEGVVKPMEILVDVIYSATIQDILNKINEKYPNVTYKDEYIVIKDSTGFERTYYMTKSSTFGNNYIITLYNIEPSSSDMTYYYVCIDSLEDNSKSFYSAQEYFNFKTIFEFDKTTPTEIGAEYDNDGIGHYVLMHDGKKIEPQELNFNNMAYHPTYMYLTEGDVQTPTYDGNYGGWKIGFGGGAPLSDAIVRTYPFLLKISGGRGNSTISLINCINLPNSEMGQGMSGELSQPIVYYDLSGSLKQGYVTSQYIYEGSAYYIFFRIYDIDGTQLEPNLLTNINARTLF